MAADFAQLAISPDGQQIVVAPSFGVQQPTPLWLRPLASTAGRLLTGTEGASFPFWSPDGRSIGFFADQKLKRLDVNSQAIQILADAPVARGGAWQADGTILFAPNAVGPLFRVPDDRWPANRRDAARDRARTIIARRSSFRTGSISFTTPEASTASPRGTRGSPRWYRDEAAARCGRCRRLYASGHLLFPRQGELLAQSFDATRLTLDGEAFRVADGVSVNPGISLASLSASASGPIAYGTDSIRRTQFTWFDRSGRRLETLGAPDQRSLANPSLSPDGSRIAFSRSSVATGTCG